MWLSCSREPRDVVAGEPEDRSLVHRFRVEAAVELYRRLVPIEDRPLHAAAVPLHGDLREIRQERAANAAAAELGYDEEIFKIQSATAQKRRVIVKPHGKADRFSADTGDYGFGRRRWSEKRRVNERVVGHDVASHALVL